MNGSLVSRQGANPQRRADLHANMARRLPDDGNRYEVVYGELLVTPAPTAWHEVLQVRLLSALDHYLQRHQCGVVLGSRADISWGTFIMK